MTERYQQNSERNMVRYSLTKGPMKLSFAMSDGTTRLMRGTLQDQLIPPQARALNGAGPQLDNLQVVWDLDKQAWRSFRWERLKDAQI